MGILGKLGSLFGKQEEDGATLSAVDREVLKEKVQETELFMDLPPENLEEMLCRMETVAVVKGEKVITEGEEGDYYYLLVEGEAAVLRRPSSGEKAKVVARLTNPRAFGEEALISNAKRNASIVMTSDGEVMRLSREAFETYVKEPLIVWYSRQQATEEIAGGAKWLDVRDSEDIQQAHLPDAVKVPMGELRDRSDSLPRDCRYICYCENGRQSSTACFLLRQRGFSVGVLRGGLQALRSSGSM